MESGVEKSWMSPKPGEFSLVPAARPIGAREVLFVGTAPLWQLDYPEIRNLARTFLASLAGSRPQTHTIAVTVHGANFGLEKVSRLSQ
jgi:hypothetical protein